MNTLLRTAALALLLSLPMAAHAQTVQITLGTVAPKDSPWWEILNRMRQDWNKASNGAVEVQIFPGGVLGDENEMVDNIKIHQIQAVGVSGVALERIVPGVGALQLPMLVDSYEDLDRLRTALEPRLEAAMEKQGFKVLNWTDVGWVHFFTNVRVSTPAALKKLNLFITADDSESEKLYRDLGFKPVPLGITDLLTALQTGLIDAFDVPPLFALSNQSFGLAKNMVNVKWAPVIGATIIDLEVWKRIPAQLRPELLRIARASGKDLRAKIRASGEAAIVKMSQNGLTVVTPAPAELEQWREMAKTARDKLRGGMVPAADFDEAVRVSKERPAAAVAPSPAPRPSIPPAPRPAK